MSDPDSELVGAPAGMSRQLVEALGADELLALAAAAPVGLFVALPPDGMVFVNDRLLEIVARERDAMLGNRWIDLVRPDNRDALLASRDELVLGSGDLDVEHLLYRPDGEARWVRVRGVRRTDRAGRPVVIGSVLDITESKRVESALRTSEATLRDHAKLLEMIAMSTPLDETLDALCRLVDKQVPDGRAAVILVDPLEDTLRVGAAPSLQRDFVDALETMSAAAFRESVDRGEQVTDIAVVTDLPSLRADDQLAAAARANGIATTWSARVRSSTDGRILGTLAIYRADARPPARKEEATLESMRQLAAVAIERSQFEHDLAHQAHHDALTGLPNRVLFGELLDHALHRSRRSGKALAVLFLDLDGFKVVNDSLGHDAGDALLVALATRLEQVLRPGDVVGRFGGDEFTVLCEDLDPGSEIDHAQAVAERIIEVVREPLMLEGEEQFVSTSVGIALASTGKERAEALIRDADAAMYRAKSIGRGTCQVFDANLRSLAQERHDLENALHRAVARREFRVFYQPIISLVDDVCIGVEALVRWQHPVRGLLAPRDFLATAEDTGLIISIGSLVLGEACAQAAEWMRSSRAADRFSVSINLSASQLTQADLGDVVSAAIERYDVPASGLSVEITETALVSDADAGATTIVRLKDRGVRVSIDDFGTGYSALNYLRQFPVDDVKIDRTFIERLGEHPDDAAIVAAVVNLGHALGMTVTAEGVETEAQLAELRALGVDAAQGYLFAPPQPPGDLTRRLVSARRWS